MKNLKLSRTPQIDIQKCMKNTSKNRFELIIFASALAREVAQKNKEEKNHAALDPVVTVLLDLQNRKE